MKDRANYVKLTVKLRNTIEAKYYEKGNKELYYSLRGQWNGLNNVTLIFNKPKRYKQCILLNKNDENIVTGEIFNNWNTTKIVHFVQLMLNDLKIEKSKKMIWKILLIAPILITSITLIIFLIFIIKDLKRGYKVLTKLNDMAKEI